jgi:hypothetical protein
MEESIPIYVPAEYFDEVSDIIRAGLKSARISPNAKSELKSWWNAEVNLVEDKRGI